MKKICSIEITFREAGIETLISKYDEAFSTSLLFTSFILFKSVCSLLLLFLSYGYEVSFFTWNCRLEIIVSTTRERK